LEPEIEPEPAPAEEAPPEVDLPDVESPEPDPEEAIILPEPAPEAAPVPAPADDILQTIAPPVRQPATSARPFATPRDTGRRPAPSIPGIEFALPPPAMGGGGGALSALMCHKLTEEQRIKAKCDLEATREAYQDAANAGLDRDEQSRLDGAYDTQLRSTLPNDTAFESFLKRNDGVQKYMLDGIDNTIFMDRKPESERQHDQLMRGDKMDWEDEVFDAHNDKE
ncbi:MAG TPA: hypothetical protein DD728_13315, partial [Hyphomonas atlantica]|nr:hypothetical protein [Hyphomonas atlantica]